MASLSQHLVKMVSARHGPFLFRIFSLFPQLSLSLHQDYFSARRLFSSLLRASLLWVHSPKKTATDRLLVTYHFIISRSCSLISQPPHPRRPFNPAEFDDEADSGEDDIIAAISSDLERGDAIYETDLTELEDVSSPRKRLRSDDNLALEPEVSFDARELYVDPLDEGGVDLSEIPEDFDKAPGTIERRERIESTVLAKCEIGLISQNGARPRRRCARRRTIICIVSYAGVSSSSEARTKNLRCYYQKLTKIVIKDKDGLEIRREFGLDTQPRKKTPNYFCTSRDRLRAVFSDLPAHVAFWYPISRAGVPESGADFEGLAAETFY
ncbi:hypothetical protein N7444_008259 [Penicillium canescens]|nr:hypothetical protein N7444_008259 [Penicillium canescens]